MARYEKYKDSGQFWLVEVPAHWNFLKMKYVFSERSQKGFPNEPLLSATQNHGVIPQSLYENRVVTATKGLESLKLVEVGDFVISLRSFQGGIEYAYYRGIISPAYTILTPKGIDASYFKHFGKSGIFIDLLKSTVTGIREGQNVDYGKLREYYLPIPPIEEQRSMALYLDSATSEIDKAIAQQQRMIDLLNERKQIIIQNAVIKGLDPNATMKEEVSFLPSVPKHWSSLKANYIFKPINERSKTGKETLLSVSEKGIKLRAELEVYMFMAQSYVGYKLCQPEDLVINSLWAWSNGLGFSPYSGIVSTAYSVFRILRKDIASFRYLEYLLKTPKYVEQYYILSKGIWKSRLTLYDWNFLRIPVLLPPIKEQNAIADYLDAECGQIDEGIQKCESIIESLQERKRIIINDVVTGKIKVS